MKKLPRTGEVARCSVVERVNRFVVKVRLNGKDYLAHTNNTGRLEQFLVEGKTAYCLKTEGKTDFKLFAVEAGHGAALIDTQLQMRAFETSLEAGLIPWLDGYTITKRNVRLGNSVIDYLLDHEGKPAYLEVKSAVLRDGTYAMYPDCPTERGRRHIKELTAHVRSGGEAIIMFIAALPGVKAFKPDRAGDPELCELLPEAKRAGVKLKCIQMVYDADDSFVCLTNPDLPVRLSA